MAFDAATGDLWRVENDSRLVYASDTPCARDGVVYAAVRSTLFAHAAEDGEVVWARAYEGPIEESVSVPGDTVRPTPVAPRLSPPAAPRAG